MNFIKGDHRFYQENSNGDLIAEITYEEVDEHTVDANHTFVDESLRGQGIAEQLVDRLAEEMKEEGKKIKASCPYIVSLFERKADKYRDITA